MAGGKFHMRSPSHVSLRRPPGPSHPRRLAGLAYGVAACCLIWLQEPAFWIGTARQVQQRPVLRAAPGGHCDKGLRGSRVVAKAETQGALDTLAKSALSRDTPPEDVFDAIRTLEKAKDREGKSGFEPLLTGDWRLIYTTGTKKTEQEIGRVNYVPITAVQRFDMSQRFIRNGVYLGPISLEFEGSLRWIEDRRRLEFDFEDLKVCGVSLPLPDFVRSAAGMKSSTPYKKQPAFEFVAVDERIAAARGAGGGVALWLRNELVQ